MVRYFYRLMKLLYRISVFKLFRKFKLLFFYKDKAINDLTIISSNCLAGCIYSDLKQEFRSPTINLFFYAPCFIDFCENLDVYLSMELIELKQSKYVNSKVNYPIGSLGDIEIHFLHYSSFELARESWRKRVTRVNSDNISFIMTDRDGFNDDIARRFERLPGRKNLLFSAKEYNIKGNVVCTKESETISNDFTTFRKYENYIDILEWYNEK